MKRSTMVAALLLATACGDARTGGSGVERSDSADIRIIRNLGPAADTIDAQRVLAVGDAGVGGDAAYAFQYVSDVVPLADGSVVVVDNRGTRVALFAEDGRWVRDLGRQGDGPGEYRSPLRAFARGDTILVWDVGLRRMTRYTADGGEAGTAPLRQSGPAGRPLAPAGDGYLYEPDEGQYADPAPARAVLARLDAAGAVVDTVVGPYPVPEIGWRIIDASTGTGMMVNPPVFAAAASWVVLSDGGVAWTPGSEPRIHRLQADGTLREIVVLFRPRVPVTAAEIEAFVSAERAQLGLDDERTLRLREESVFAATLPAIPRIVAGDGGSLWAAHATPRTRQGEAAAWEIVGPDGAVRRHVRFPDAFQLRAVRGERAYGITTTADGVHVVEVYEVARDA